jgi:hypothetical protein
MVNDNADMLPSSRWGARTKLAIVLVLLLIVAVSAASLLYQGDNFRGGGEAQQVHTGGKAGTGPPLADKDPPPEGRMTHPPK